MPTWHVLEAGLVRAFGGLALLIRMSALCVWSRSHAWRIDPANESVRAELMRMNRAHGLVHSESADAETVEAIDETMRAAPPADASEARMASDASAMAGLSATCWQALRSDSGLNDSSFAPAPAR